MRQTAEKQIPILQADPAAGLSNAQAAERLAAGYGNTPPKSPGKTAAQIVAENVFTFFNGLFFLFAALLIAAGAWNNLLFLGVVLFNTTIGIVQELRSKKTLDRLSLLDMPECTVIRGGDQLRLPTNALVRDDIVRFSAGDQICADAQVVLGSCTVNESLVTGEADELPKNPGDPLLSGSFVTSGTVTARLTAVGAQSHASKLTVAARKHTRRKQPEMMRDLQRLLHWVGILIVPFGTLLAVKECVWLGRGFESGIVSAVGALIGLIPEGLYLLTSIALSGAVIRLAEKKVLTRELSCVETLSRVDVLCVDKTGTITTGELSVCDVEILQDGFEIGTVVSDLLAATGDENATACALRDYFGAKGSRQTVRALPFSSARKFSGAEFSDGETWLLGAPDVLLQSFGSDPRRTILLAKGNLDGTNVAPMALIRLEDTVRPSAKATFAEFRSRGVAIKVISGDSPLTASAAAIAAGIEGAENAVDARTLSEDELSAAVERYTVFGRVTPERKQQLIRALKQRGHTVAMTGDGVNDVLALKEADCAVAMASGSDAASRVSDLVLLESDFSVMPLVAAEGRRVVGNLCRSASLFLVKNLFSFAFSLLTLLVLVPYPFTAVRMTFVSSLTIGIPGFFLALEPDEQRITGRFLHVAALRALPSALADLVLCLAAVAIAPALQLTQNEIGTVCTIAAAIVGILTVVRVSLPLTPLRRILIAGLCLALALGTALLGKWFMLTPLPGSGWALTAALSALAAPLLFGFSKILPKP